MVIKPFFIFFLEIFKEKKKLSIVVVADYCAVNRIPMIFAHDEFVQAEVRGRRKKKGPEGPENELRFYDPGRKTVVAAVLVADIQGRARVRTESRFSTGTI